MKKKTTHRCITLGALVLLLAPVFAATPEDANPLQAVAWLAGCWTGKAGSHDYEEYWMPARGGIMLGMARATNEDELSGIESLQISVNEAGLLVYTANPSGQDAASFTETELTPTGIIFENLRHDFPQRLSYRLEGGNLLARAEGPGKDGGTRGIDFILQRTPCPAGSP